MPAPTAKSPKGKWLLALAGLLLAGALGAYLWWPAPTAVPPEVPLEELDREVVEVVTAARAAVLQAPRSGVAWGHFGRVLIANELYPEISLVCFREAERLDPKNPRWPYFAGVLLQRQGTPAEVVAKLRRAVELCQESGAPAATPRLVLAETLLSLDQLETAESEFQEALAEEPANPRARFGLAQLAYARGAWQVCRQHLESCLGSPQARKKAAAQLATVCGRLQDEQGAQQFAALAARFPRDIDWTDPFVVEHVYLTRRKRDRVRAVERLEAEGLFNQAATLLTGLVEEHPNDYLPHLMMGRVRARLGQLQTAEEHLHKAQQLAPDKIQVDYFLSLVLRLQGEALLQKKEKGAEKQAQALFEEAVKAARRVLAVNPDYGVAHMSLGEALKHFPDRQAEALAAFRQAVHCNPEHYELHLLLGQALAEEGTVGEARFHLEQAALLAGPNDPRPRDALKKLLAKAKN